MMSNETKILGGIGIATLIIVIAAAFLVGGKSSPEKDKTALSEDLQKTLVREDSYKKGATNGKVTVVEFGDFQCPACGATYPIVKQLVQEYKDKVTFVFREFPLTMHKYGEQAALAAEAAGRQGKFYQMHDLLFDNQKKWSESKNAKEIFITYAEQLKLDVDKFKKDIEDAKLKDKIKRDISDGMAAGVNSTPTFYINGVQQEGVMSYDEFKGKIDKILKEAK